MNGDDTFVIIVGIAEYNHTAYPNLPAAARDAANVKQALSAWGISPQNILLFTNSNATRINILNSIRVWPIKKSIKINRVIFYFAGHGIFFSKSKSTSVSILLVHDTQIEDPLSTSISVEEIIDALTSIEANEYYLFLDACYLSLDNVKNVFFQNPGWSKKIKSKTSKCFFCICSAGNDKAYEDSKLFKSFFTKALLSNLALLRHGQGATVIQLAEAIERDLNTSKIQKPEIYFLGNTNTFPINYNSGIKKNLGNINNKIINRAHAIARFQDVIIGLEKRIICLSGESGLGKSVFVQQFSALNELNIYYSISLSEHDGKIDETLNTIIKITSEKFNIKTVGVSIVEAFIAILDEINILFIDHIERLSDRDLKTLIKIVQQERAIVVLIGVKRIINKGVFNWKLDGLTVDEVKRISHSYSKSQFSPKILATVSKGNPLKLKSILTNPRDKTLEILKSEEFKDVIEKICVCQGYMNEELFRKTYKIDIEQLSFLFDLGLIRFEIDHFVPHDTLYSLQSGTTINSSEKALLYWNPQIREAPKNTWACYLYIEIITNTNFKKAPDEISLSFVVKKIIYLKDWLSLEKILFKMIREWPHYHEPILIATEQLIHLAYHDVVSKILTFLKRRTLSIVERERYLIIKSEQCFWLGKFNVSLKIAKYLTTSLISEHRYTSSLHTGINLFFLGRWKKALEYLHRANSDDAIPRDRAWAKMLIATIEGIRGTNLTICKIFFEASIIELEKIDDFVGLGIALNNYGEVAWKMQDYRTALTRLHSAARVAELIKDHSTLLEINRNLTHVYLRFFGSDSFEITDSISKMKKLMSKVSDFVEMMQVWNTLGIAYAYKGDIVNLKRSIINASRFTKNNLEYDIYTHENYFLYYSFKGNVDKAVKSLNIALSLARKGNNWLAIKQIEGDFICISSSYKLIMSELYHQIIKAYASKNILA